MVKLEVFAPEILPPSERSEVPLRHWYVWLFPVVTTEKLAELPLHTVWSVGCVVMEILWCTVSVAAEEVTEGVHVPFTIT